MPFNVVSCLLKPYYLLFPVPVLLSRCVILSILLNCAQISYFLLVFPSFITFLAFVIQTYQALLFLMIYSRITIPIEFEFVTTTTATKFRNPRMTYIDRAELYKARKGCRSPMRLLCSGDVDLYLPAYFCTANSWCGQYPHQTQLGGPFTCCMRGPRCPYYWCIAVKILLFLLLSSTVQE
jgi:hypothetical protein